MEAKTIVRGTAMSNSTGSLALKNYEENQSDGCHRGCSDSDDHRCSHGNKKEFIGTSLELLRKSGYRITGPRKLVLDCLAQVSRPLSPRGMLEHIEADSSTPNIDQVSIYRILEALYELGIVHKVGPSGEYIACHHLDCHAQPHILLRCTSCNAINEIDVPQPVVEPMRWFLKEKHQFMPDAHMFQIDGLCQTCVNKGH